MTSFELTIIRLAELAAIQIAQNRNAQGLKECKVVAFIAGELAGDARKSLERATGIKVVSRQNFLPKNNN